MLPKEIESFDTATKLLTDVLVTFFVLSVLELLIYLAYNIYVSISYSVYDYVQLNLCIYAYQVHPWKEILQDTIVDVRKGKL